MIFQMTSNYPPSNTDAGLHVWRGRRAHGAIRDFRPGLLLRSRPPSTRAMMSKGQVAFAKGTGCAPPLVSGAFAGSILAMVRHWLA